MSVIFLIPLIAKARASNWRLTNELLLGTLNSLRNQTDENWTAVLACHDKPEFKITDKRIQTIRFNHDVAKIHPQNDKAIKLATSLHDWHCCMGLDADDLIHCDLAKHLNANPNTRAWRVNHGYQLDYPSQRVFEHRSLGSICGSTTILDRDTCVVPEDESEEELHKCWWWKYGHQSFPAELERRKIAVEEIPFPALLYTVNQGSDWQNIYDKNFLLEQVKRFVKFRLRGREFSKELVRVFGQSSRPSEHV